MNRILKRTLLPGLMAASLASVSLVPVQPAAADDQILRDIGIGAAAGVISGGVRGRGSIINNAVKGAAAGAAVNGVHSTRRQPKNRRNRNIIQDVGIGAAAGTAAGAITRGGKDTLGDAVDGAAAGAAIHVITNGRGRR
ncbi:MAG: hypothetical protein KME32_02835 [Mojavia pulchra JT2-VF2]|jgi:hypothetical protein|uniref:Glycine zipper 2TM domain-containing protein n=1 Tax=Mojavia pulchra JT2-VF2 TaxID=287848 RepID=A0A951UE21_9NOST|nr:hypothetical protein [Mojavia pulchra JT2-VF2]